MKNILVIEDEREVRLSIIELLENAGYKIISAEDGQQAIQLLESGIPDLVISDIMMPKINGYQVLEHFQKVAATAKIPFIFLSAKADHSDIRFGMNGGADDYMTKPFRAKELLRAVEARLKKAEKVEKTIEEICMNISTYVPHELKTPLVSMMGYTELLKDDLADMQNPEINEMLDNIKTSNKRLNTTLDKFVKYTEIQTRFSSKLKKEEQIPSTISLVKITESYCADLICEAKRENDLMLELVDAEINISEDDYKFMVREIIENALKFSNPGSKILVRSCIQNNKYYLEITDYGKGMTADQISNINPFIQHDRKIDQQRGNGLGLVSVKKLMEFYNGQFNVFSRYKEYTMVSLLFPLRHMN